MTVVEKYVETDGCALHGHHHDHDHHQPAATATATNKCYLMPPSSHSEMPPSSPSPVNGPNFIFHCSRRRLPIEAAKKLQSASPVLGSPSVVKKARSLLPPAADDDVEDDNGTSSKVTTMTRQRFVA